MLYHSYPEHLYRSDHRFVLPKRTLTRFNPMYFRGALAFVGLLVGGRCLLDVFGVWMESPRLDFMLEGERRRRHVAEYAFEMPAVLSANPLSHFSHF